MSNYDIVRDACVRASPEIQGEHVFEIGYNKCSFCGEPRIVRDRIVHREVVDERSGGSSREVSERNIDQTGFPCRVNMPRPVRLADVLLAIQTANDRGELEGKMGTCGIFDLWSDAVGYIGNEWNLRNDSLEWHRDNAPEVIDWLAELLTQKQP